MVFENKYIRPLERRYFRWLLLIVASNAVVAALLSASGTGWALWENAKSSERALIEQAQHIAIVSLNSAKEDIYQIDFSAIEDQLETTVDLATGNSAHLNMCIRLNVTHQITADPILFVSCNKPSLMDFIQEEGIQKQEELVLGNRSIATTDIFIKLQNDGSVWVSKALLVAFLVILSQIPIFMAVNYNFLYRRLLKPLILSLGQTNYSLKKNLRLREQEQRIRESMMRLSSLLAKTKIQDAEKAYISELHNEQTFPSSIVLSKKKYYAQAGMEQTAKQLLASVQKFEAEQNIEQQLVLLNLTEKNNELAEKFAKYLPDGIDKNAYLLAFRLSVKDHLMWIYLPASEDDGESNYAATYVSYLTRQYEDFQKFRQNMIDETLDTYRALTKKDGTLPVAEDTVYVEYAHPNALIYDTKRKERKVRLSLTKLQQLFPDHLVQASKAYLVNPKHVLPEDLDVNGKVVKVKMGRSKIRIPVSPVYHPVLEQALKS